MYSKNELVKAPEKMQSDNRIPEIVTQMYNQTKVSYVCHLGAFIELESELNMLRNKRHIMILFALAKI